MALNLRHGRTFLIAEAGTAHSALDPADRRNRALLYCRVAAAQGADAIKFQMFVPNESLFCPVDGDEGRWKRWRQSFLTLDDWAAVRDEAKRLGLVFLASAFQDTAVDWLRRLNVAAYKVASRAEILFPYRECPGPFIVSCRIPSGDPGEYHRNAYHLYCVPEYPCPLDKARWPGPKFDGLSDHSGTIWPGLDAIFRGARILEVHFAIDKDHAGPDGPVSLEGDQLGLLCQARDAVVAMRGGVVE